jgi:hypothetical protein
MAGAFPEVGGIGERVAVEGERGSVESGPVIGLVISAGVDRDNAARSGLENITSDIVGDDRFECRHQRFEIDGPPRFRYSDAILLRLQRRPTWPRWLYAL